MTPLSRLWRELVVGPQAKAARSGRQGNRAVARHTHAPRRLTFSQRCRIAVRWHGGIRPPTLAMSPSAEPEPLATHTDTAMRFQDYLLVAGQVSYHATARLAAPPRVSLPEFRQFCDSIPQETFGGSTIGRVPLLPGIEVGRGFPLLGTFALAFSDDIQRVLEHRVLAFWRTGHPVPFLLAAAALPRTSAALAREDAEAIMCVLALSALAVDRQYADDMPDRLLASRPVVVSAALPGFQVLAKPVLDQVFQTAVLLGLADASAGHPNVQAA